MYGIQYKRHELNRESFLIYSYLRIAQDYFQPKFCRKIRIFSRGRRKLYSYKRKRVRKGV